MKIPTRHSPGRDFVLGLCPLVDRDGPGLCHLSGGVGLDHELLLLGEGEARHPRQILAIGEELLAVELLLDAHVLVESAPLEVCDHLLVVLYRNGRRSPAPRDGAVGELHRLLALHEDESGLVGGGEGEDAGHQVVAALAHRFALLAQVLTDLADLCLRLELEGIEPGLLVTEESDEAVGLLEVLRSVRGAPLDSRSGSTTVHDLPLYPVLRATCFCVLPV